MPGHLWSSASALFLRPNGITLGQSAARLTIFLSGRLLGYCGWAVLILASGHGDRPKFGRDRPSSQRQTWSWARGSFIMESIDRGVIRGQNVLGPVWGCSDSPLGSRRVFFRGGVWGFLSGLQICPPFLAAINGAAQTRSLGSSFLFFFLFYLGTGVWFIPFPFVGVLGRFRQVAQVARFCAVPLGAFYVYSGVISIAGGNPFHG